MSRIRFNLTNLYIYKRPQSGHNENGSKFHEKMFVLSTKNPVILQAFPKSKN